FVDLIKDASGEEMIEAYVLGVEVWSKVSLAIPMLQLRGWHPTAVFGTIGATAAAAKLLKLDVKQTTNAIGLACSEASGLGQNFGTMTKPFHAGNSARSGIMAALLAREGFTAAKDIMEGDMGFPAAFYGESPANISQMAEKLGDPFTLVSRGINVKRYPSCAGTHRPIDALLHLIDSYQIKPEEVEAVDCRVSPRARKILLYDNPDTGFEGKFSIPFVMAAAVKDAKIELAQFTDEYVNSPAIKGLMKRVSLRIHPDWAEGKDTDARPDIVAIKLADGREYSYGVALAKGHAKVPLTDEEFLAKYRECAKLVLGGRETERCLELINRLDKLEDISELMDILVFPR
ncbi:MmgE/PrpD family protein, partial [Chloroflexota bacterium]